MSTSTKLLVAVCGLYLAGGIPSLIPALRGAPIIQGIATVYLACIAVGIVGCVLAFARKRAARWLVLVPLFVLCAAVGSNRGPAAVFPSFVSFPLTFTMSYPSGLVVFAGINAAPVLLLVLLSRRLRREASGGDAAAEGEPIAA